MGIRADVRPRLWIHAFTPACRNEGPALCHDFLRPNGGAKGWSRALSSGDLGLTDLPVGLACHSRVQPLSQKYSCFLLTQITSISAAIPSRGGAYRDRHGRWARDAVDAGGAKDESADLADGEVVWS